MKILITGMNGTVAPSVASYFKSKGHQIIAYDRKKVSTEKESDITNYFLDEKFDWCLHFAMGSNEWTGLLAKISYELHVNFVYISTVSVFSDRQVGPFHITDIPKPESEYGIYKRQGELISKKYNPNVYILRLGWQIGHNYNQNQMLNYLNQQMTEKGFIEASSKWYPSASFLDDTAKAIYDICIHQSPDLYHINSNYSYTFYDIVKYLSTLYPKFIVKESQDFQADHRMNDLRVKIRKFKEIIKNQSD